MLEDKEVAQKVLKSLQVEDFTVLLHRKIVSAIERLLKDDKEINSQKVIDCLDDDKAANIISRILMEEVITFDEKVISGYINTINNYKLVQEKKDLEKKAKTLDEKIKKSEKIEESDLKELGKIAQQLKSRNVN